MLFTVCSTAIRSVITIAETGKKLQKPLIDVFLKKWTNMESVAEPEPYRFGLT
jgi:hypothetical protein